MHIRASSLGSVRFGPFVFDPRSGDLVGDGVTCRLSDQPLALLTALLEHPGQLVTREELRQRLWPDGTFVDFDHGLNSAVRRLREALKDSATTPRFVETVPRRGYRRLVPVDVPGHDIDSAKPGALPPESVDAMAGRSRADAAPVRRSSRWPWMAAALIVVLAAIAWLALRLRTDTGARSGYPFTVFQNTNPSSTLTAGGPVYRPDRIGLGHVENPTVDRWFAVEDFIRPTEPTATYGSSGRNILRGPGQFTIDASIGKLTRIGPVETEFRVEAFNLLNQPVFANPASTIGIGNVGTISSLLASTPMRQLQFVLKARF